MNEIEFKKYTHWPNIKKMDKDREDNIDNYDYMAFCFEISMTKENKVTNAYLAGYLFLDFYKEDRKISFDIPNTENDSNNFFIYRIDNQKNNIKKNVTFENGTAKVSMKPETTFTTYEPTSSYADLTYQFIEKDIIGKLNEIMKFLEQHKISYEKKEVDEYRKQFLENAKDFFADKLLPKSIIDKYSEISSILLYEKMDKYLTTSPIKKAHKI